MAMDVSKQLTRNSFKQWIASLDAFLFDCDGVLWRGAAPIEGAANAIKLLRSLNKRVVSLVFTASMALILIEESYEFESIFAVASQGIDAVEDEIVTSAWATAQYMKQHKIEGKVYMVGEAGLQTELELEGYQVSGMDHSDIKGLPHVPDIDMETKAVVCGLDRDTTYPVDGAIIPGGGSLVHMLECAIGHPPEAICGKPSQDLLQTVVANYSLEPARTCMVGDRLSTDIEFGNAGGLQTLLVLTGVTHESELGSIDNALHVPDHYVDSVNAINVLHAEILEN
ncbi:hypothetical protein PsorP6_004442 [Peronosclerospora sorghi]|uniref:Uncharacterized protein n=1 Tax=Peronosclerospora sorghi TaxID=230839 RepID=A0ACC0VRG5_9STRA|nr:hypothetical protein PsorP6_004442 [Peronosclerospora sorghi]